jgi:hypothetical protein
MLNSLQTAPGYGVINKALSGYVPATGNIVASSYLASLTNAEIDRQTSYLHYREYYDGEHDTMLTERMRSFLQVKDSQEFNYNLCPIVVDALAERLKVTGLDAGEQGELFWGWWDANRLDGIQGIVHTAAIRDGDTYVMVEWDAVNARPRIVHEMACAGGDGIKVHYSQEHRGEIEYASKRWVVERNGAKSRRLNLYYADHIEKYVTSDYESNYQPYLDGSPTGLILPGQLGKCGWYWWTDSGAQGGRPLGVPVVHFKNKDQGYDWGQSELHDVIPLQNAQNKALIDLIASSDTAGFRVYVALGDKWAGMKIFPGAIWMSERPPTEADLKAIEGEDPSNLIAVVDKFVTAIAQVSRTPISYFQVSKQRPAEGTLQQEESGLVAKTEKCQTDFGNSWENAFAIARRLANAFGGQKLDEKQSIDCQWKEAQTRNEVQHLETLVLKKQLGVPDKQIWREMGYDDKKIAEFQKLKLKAAAQSVRMFQGAGQAASMKTGSDNGNEEPGTENRPAVPFGQSS